jgi:Trypsin-like peptidase domain
MTTLLTPSVQSLLIEMFAGNQLLGTGTAFVCNSGKGPVLLTNWHNITGRNPETKQPMSKTGAIPDAVRIAHNRANKVGEWLAKTESLFSGGRPRWVEHPTLAERVDVVALPLSDLADVQLYPYELQGGPTIAVHPADAVSVVGFPFGLQAGGSLAIWATGFVASELDIDFKGLPLFLVDCRARPGQSGSAVIAHRNGGAVAMQGGGTTIVGGPITRFLGIYSGRVNDQSDLGMVWKASAVAEVVGSI